MFGALLLILIILTFASFAFGAYLVFNHPVSNVVAKTLHSGDGAVLKVNATSLESNTQRIVWVDPSIGINGSNGLPAAVDPTSGVRVANAPTDQNGTLQGSFQLSGQQLASIASDGWAVHHVWIVGLRNAVSGSGGYTTPVTIDSEENFSAATQESQITLFASLLIFQVPLKTNLGQVFIALWTIYIVMFAMALHGPLRSVLGSLRQASKTGLRAIFDNSMFGMIAVFPIVLWATVLSALAQQAGGIPTGSLPAEDGLLLFVELTLAPLREEVGFRVIPIGLAAFLILLSRKRLRDSVMSLWHPSRYLKRNDAPGQYRRDMWVIYAMIAVGSFLFGLAHVLLGAGWGPGKILDAAIAGVALGFLYYQYGLPAAVLLHWAIDYFLTVYDPLTTPSLAGEYYFIVLYTMGLAVISSVVLIVLFVRSRRGSLSPFYRPGI